MKNILSIDTTADICSIALLVGDEWLQFHETRPREHAKILMPEIQRLLTAAQIKPDDLDLIVFGRGPGSFTGVRIAAGVAQGLGFSSGCSLLPVSTLQALAFQAEAGPGDTIWAALDARMSEMYFAEFILDQDGIPQLQGDEQVLPPEQLPPLPDHVQRLVGNGWTAGYELPTQVSERIVAYPSDIRLPHAAHSLRLALGLMAHGHSLPVPPEQAVPVYIRDKVTWDKKPKVGS